MMPWLQVGLLRPQVGELPGPGHTAAAWGPRGPRDPDWAPGHEPPTHPSSVPAVPSGQAWARCSRSACGLKEAREGRQEGAGLAAWGRRLSVAGGLVPLPGKGVLTSCRLPACAWPGRLTSLHPGLWFPSLPVGVWM